jgi:hypothetical protein
MRAELHMSADVSVTAKENGTPELGWEAGIPQGRTLLTHRRGPVF